MTDSRPPVVLALRPPPIPGGTLKAVCDIQFPSGLLLRAVAVHVAGSRAWCSPPSPMVDFANHGVRRRWSEAILAVLRVSHPDLFAGHNP